ncbi:ubiquitin-conjugating enzyme subfamily protein [Cardiosporidium cionae]|uniref:Ubiquitin-conjugating enzyme subfamily protein n=1 Tax=Cardiosporidium cionae TaxID=476202 RepID=A0ABQ7JFE3_9APIC|nr:ubiquitin-conjugating enzyme subfamily protein [Cardiosporidium cionae]|eukprot:KAF8822751.1 ubiquitin-conjugating enzyme subfamily protein [Cardiosporidium cionae]
MEAGWSKVLGKSHTNTEQNSMYATENNSTVTSEDSWSCRVCTLINNKDVFECEVCGASKQGYSSTTQPESSHPSKDIPPQNVVQAPKMQAPTISKASPQARKPLSEPFSSPSPVKSYDTKGLSAAGLRRLDKERRDLQNKKIEGVRLLKDLGQSWLVEIDGAKNTLYENETFQINFAFNCRYPFDAPEVIFTRIPPIHPHVYSNGHICLSILYDEWTPVLGVAAVCLSLISMLSSCNKKEKPIDDTVYCHRIDSAHSPKSTNWFFHDDKV